MLAHRIIVYIAGTFLSIGGMVAAAQAQDAQPRPAVQDASIKITVDTYGHLIPGSNKAAVDRLDTTGRNPRATAPDKHARDVAVTGGSSWLPGLGSNQRLPD